MSNTLIRLKSTSEDGIFDCSFQDEIIVEQNSEIALQSCVIPTLDKQIELTSLNNIILVKTDVDLNQDLQIQLPTGDFNFRNVSFDLIPSLIQSGNTELSIFKSSQIGAMFDCFIDTNQLLNIRMLQSPFLEFTNLPINTADLTFGSHLTVNQDGDLVNTQPDGSQNLSRSSCIMNYNFCSGGGCFRAVVDTFTDAKPFDNRTEAFLGLINIQSDAEAKLKNHTFEENDFTYAIRIPSNPNVPLQVLEPSTNGRYVESVDENGQPVLLEIAESGSTDCPVIEIGLSNGRVFLSCYNGGNAPRKNLTSYLQEEAPFFPHNELLTRFKCVVINTANPNVIRLTQVEATPDPFETERLNIVHTPLIKATSHTIQSLPPTKFNVIFQSLETAKFLGFTRNTLNEFPVDENELFFIGEKIIPNPNNTLTHLIELLDFPLKSYDSTGLNGTRRNILASIPVLPDLQGVLQYEPSEKYYIRIDNTQKMSFRNIRARIVDSNFNGIETIGDTFINILVRKVQN